MTCVSFSLTVSTCRRNSINCHKLSQERRLHLHLSKVTAGTNCISRRIIRRLNLISEILDCKGFYWCRFFENFRLFWFYLDFGGFWIVRVKEWSRFWRIMECSGLKPTSWYLRMAATRQIFRPSMSSWFGVWKHTLEYHLVSKLGNENKYRCWHEVAAVST